MWNAKYKYIINMFNFQYHGNTDGMEKICNVENSVFFTGGI